MRMHVKCLEQNKIISKDCINPNLIEHKSKPDIELKNPQMVGDIGHQRRTSMAMAWNSVDRHKFQKMIAIMLCFG